MASHAPAPRLPVLDGVRGLASAMVVVYHYFPNIAELPSGTLGARLAALVGPLQTGVDLFFVLSGFLISGILIDARSSTNYFRVFYIRRCCRIFPVYYLFVATFAILSAVAPFPGNLYGGRVPFWSYLVYQQNWIMAWRLTYGAAFLAGTWSLAIEEQFYGILPAIVRFWGAPHRLPWIAGSFIGVAVVTRVLLRYAGMNEASFFLLPTRCDALGAGMLIAIVYRNGQWWPKLARVAPAGLALSILGAFALRGVAGRYTISAAMYGFLIVYVLACPSSALARFLTSAPMRGLGIISYSMYMLHHIVMRYCFFFLLHRDPAIRSFGDLLPCAVALPVVLALCAISWRWFEKPIMQWGHRHKYAVPARVALAT